MISQRKIVVIITFASSVVCILAQQTSKYIDVIYFKDGTKVDGIIVYKVPNVRVSINRHNFITETDSVYTYPLEIIERIVKEPIRRSQTEEISSNSTVKSSQPTNLKGLIKDTPFSSGLLQQSPDIKFKANPHLEKVYIPEPSFSIQPNLTSGQLGISDPSDPEGIYRKLKNKDTKWNMEISGLRFITDYQYTQGIGNIKNNRFDFKTSLGFQFNPHVYTGFGVAYSLTLNKKESSLPLFVDTKINFLDKKVTPFFNLKAGYSVMEAKGFYLSPNIGVSVFPRGTQALSIGLGYSYQQAKYKKWSDESNKRISFNENYHGLYIKLSYEINIISIK